MSLKILYAGASEGDRERMEAQVRAALGELPAKESWTVSLVRIGRQWSVTLDGPDPRFKGRNFAVPDGRIGDSIAEALGRRSGFGANAPRGDFAEEVQKPTVEKRDQRECGRCDRPFVVVYEAVPDEPEEAVPVACPHCWQVDHVSVGRAAALSRDYRADRLES